MLIELKDGLFIKPEPLQWTLLEKTVIKEGKTKGTEVETPLGYFNSLPDCLMWAARHKLSKIENKTVKLENAVTLLRQIYEQMWNRANVT